MKHKSYNPNSEQSGFTLIEMIFYVLFISIIVGGTFGIIYQLLRNSENLKTGISIEEEGNFILKKISWALNDSSAIISPVQNSNSSFLIVNKNDFGSDNPVVINFNSGIINISRGGGTSKQLSNDRFTVTDLTFVRTWDGSNPETDLIRASFDIDGQPFSISRKIR